MKKPFIISRALRAVCVLRVVCAVCAVVICAAAVTAVYAAVPERVPSGRLEAAQCDTAAHIPGDINGDGRLTNADLTRMMKYLAGDDVEVNQSSLDVNGDGKVNNRDLTLLMKRLADPGVEIY